MPSCPIPQNYRFLTGRHKSWVNRRLALIERFTDEARESLRLGLLTWWQVVQVCASRMTSNGKHPNIVLVEGNYPTGVIVPKQEMKEINKRIIRVEKLP